MLGSDGYNLNVEDKLSADVLYAPLLRCNLKNERQSLPTAFLYRVNKEVERARTSFYLYFYVRMADVDVGEVVFRRGQVLMLADIFRIPFSTMCRKAVRNAWISAVGLFLWIRRHSHCLTKLRSGIFLNKVVWNCAWTPRPKAPLRRRTPLLRYLPRYRPADKPQKRNTPPGFRIKIHVFRTRQIYRQND